MKKLSRPKAFRGEVVSDRMQKTVVVRVTRFEKAPKYGKYVKLSKRFKAHDETNEYKIGDKVEIAQTRPRSAGKRWVVSRLLARASKVERKAERAEPEL